MFFLSVSSNLNKSIYSHSGSLSSSVVAQERCDLTLVQIQTQFVDSQLAVLVDLCEIVDAHAQRNMTGLRFEARRF